MQTHGKVLMPRLDFNRLRIYSIGDSVQHYHTTREPACGLSYTFQFHKEKLQSNPINRNKLDDYIYDLENTWILNIDMICNLVPDSEVFTHEQKKYLNVMLKRIKENFKKKKILRLNQIKMRGKILMDKQVLEEHKRRNDENHLYHEEQLTEISHNFEKKDSLIRQMEKKFNEVETYIQRESKNKKDRFQYFATFDINLFISSNEIIHRKILILHEEIKVIRENIQSIQRENVELRKRDKRNEISEEQETGTLRHKQLIGLFSNKINFFERYKQHLQCTLNSLTCNLELVNKKKIKIKAVSDISIKHQDIFCIQLDKLLGRSSKEGPSEGEILEEQNELKENSKRILSMNFLGQGAKDWIQEDDGGNKSLTIDIDEKKEIGEVGGTTENWMENIQIKSPECQKNKIREAGWDISCIEQNE